MAQLTQLLTEELQGLLDAENQLTKALPKMASAAHNQKLKEAFTKHLAQTQTHVERLNQALGILGTKTEAKPCRAMEGLIEAGQERIKEVQGRGNVTADLALIGAAQTVEHYEISAYGTARSMARLIGEREVAQLLSHTLGEEEAADFLLTEAAKPILQDIVSTDSKKMGTVPGKSHAVAS
ncbi:MAG: ferritin-like domain-containing protein [Acidobacteriaceae bacterium]|nr:ferritin-like domain-containing protein [Acidobacteriaceae bacterium]